MSGGQGGPSAGFGGNDKSSDVELQAMIADVMPKFQLLTWDDEESSTSLQYQLINPENYDVGQTYPLLQFIPDSSVVGGEADSVRTRAGVD